MGIAETVIVGRRVQLQRDHGFVPLRLRLSDLTHAGQDVANAHAVQFVTQHPARYADGLLARNRFVDRLRVNVSNRTVYLRRGCFDMSTART